MGNGPSITKQIKVVNCYEPGVRVKVFNGDDTTYYAPVKDGDKWMYHKDESFFYCKCASCNDCNVRAILDGDVTDGHTLLIGPKQQLETLSGTNWNCDNISYMPFYNRWYNTRTLEEEEGREEEYEGVGEVEFEAVVSMTMIDDDNHDHDHHDHENVGFEVEEADVVVSSLSSYLRGGLTIITEQQLN